MNTLPCISDRARVAAKDAPFEFELRVSRGRLEIWRFCEEYRDRKVCRFRQTKSAKLRKSGQKFPKLRQLFWHEPPHFYRAAIKRAKSAWKEAERPKRWCCRFNAYAIIESGVLDEEE